MALAGEKVGIPSAEEAPLGVMARFKQFEVMIYKF